MHCFSNFILRRAGWVIFLSSILAILGTYYSIKLYKNLRTDIQELLPSDSRSVVDLKKVSHRLESIDNLAILVFSKHSQKSKEFIIDLAHRLNREPKSILSSVNYKIDQELKFFKKRQALYIELDDLIRIRNYIKDRIEYEKTLYNPLTIFSEIEIPEPTLNFLAIKQKYEIRASGFSHFPNGFYASQDETKRALLVNMPSKNANIESQKKLKAVVEHAIKELNPASYSTDLEIHFTGGVEDSIEEQEALVEDLETSTVIVTVIVALGMWLFYRAIRATFALVLSLFIGTFWTFGISYFAVGYLNANSAFLGSIVIGNGINFGIIFLARYMEERRNQLNHPKAIQMAITHTATSTWTAALAAGLSYGSLMLTRFRGFKQFGVIGLIGMVFCWISAFTILPALLTYLEKLGPIVKSHSKPPKSRSAKFIAKWIGEYPQIIWTLSLIALFVSLASFTKFHPTKILEFDMTKLRNRDSLTKGSVYYSKIMDQIFQHYLSPIVILPNSKVSTYKISQDLKEQKLKEGKSSLIASVQTIEDFIPHHQTEKIKVLNEIQNLLTPPILKHLSSEDRKLVEEFLTPESLQSISQSDLPPLVLEKFTEKNGSIGKMILVEPPLYGVSDNSENILKFIQKLREAADSIEPGTPVAGSMAISADMMEAISRDGPMATFFAFIAVVILVILLFRNPKNIGWVLGSLFFGVAWLGGFIILSDIKINFLNFIALPITFGIGIDYGVNIFQRYKETGGKDILKVIKNTGSAVGLCSFSTIVGYSSLLIARNQGFVSFGQLAVAGELTCVIAAVISLPAYLTTRSKKKV